MAAATFAEVKTIQTTFALAGGLSSNPVILCEYPRVLFTAGIL